MKLASTVSWSALATLIRLANGFVSIKVVALLIGPLGVALIGQFGNLTSIVMTLALGGISTGVIKYTSQYKDNPEELNKVWHTITWVSMILSIPVIIVLLVFHNWLAQEFLHDAAYGSILVVFAFSLGFYVANSLLLNILNGLHQIKRFNLLNTLNSILGLLVTIGLVYQYKVYGALLGIVISQSITFFVVVFFVHKQTWFKLSNFFGKFDRFYFKKLMGFTVMSLTTMCVGPTSQMFIRGYLASHTSWDVAGCWQGMQKISDTYLMIANAALWTYFLPKFASLHDQKQISAEIRKGYLFLLPFLAISAVSLFISRHLIINLLFSKSFLAMSGMFFWQLLGDCLKISAWILGCLMGAKDKIKLFVVTEVLFGVSYPLFSYGLINLVGTNGAVMAFALNYMIYLVLFIVLYKKGFLTDRGCTR
ncbi:MAG: O-antigen translocase [Gammaproteobacteria bacterium]|nr:O-antigen translocase [Gammaproteobacteria bacterium]